jgi:hypothetical protein
MGEKLSPAQLELYQGIDEILWRDWDPIGVSDMPEARDEYHFYLPVVFDLVLRGASTSDIAGYLTRVARENMGLPPDIGSSRAVAEKIIQLKRRIGI